MWTPKAEAAEQVLGHTVLMQGRSGRKVGGHEIKNNWSHRANRAPLNEFDDFYIACQVRIRMILLHPFTFKPAVSSAEDFMNHSIELEPWKAIKLRRSWERKRKLRSAWRQVRIVESRKTSLYWPANQIFYWKKFKDIEALDFLWTAFVTALFDKRWGRKRRRQAKSSIQASGCLWSDQWYFTASQYREQTIHEP